MKQYLIEVWELHPDASTPINDLDIDINLDDIPF